MRKSSSWWLRLSVGAVMAACTSLAAFAQVNVTIYSGYSPSGSGTPYSNPVGTFNAPQVNFLIGTGFNWHPYGKTGFGALITGYLRIPTTRTYTFGLVSDDGSRLYLNNVLYADNPGLHGPQLGAGSPILLTAGTIVPFKIEFWQDGLGPSGVDLDLQDANLNFNLVPSSWYVVPEPSTFAAAAMGLSALLLKRRK